MRRAYKKPPLVFSSSCHATGQVMMMAVTIEDGHLKNKTQRKERKNPRPWSIEACRHPASPALGCQPLPFFQPQLAFPFSTLRPHSLDGKRASSRRQRISPATHPVNRSMDAPTTAPGQAANVLRRSHPSSALQSTPLCSWRHKASPRPPEGLFPARVSSQSSCTYTRRKLSSPKQPRRHSRSEESSQVLTS
ncbi:hypothetical protein BKA80DRAFT_55290 [Phyllosticta citrichinensis]